MCRNLRFTSIGMPISSSDLMPGKIGILILNGGHWTLGNSLIVKKWAMSFSFAKEEMAKVLVWINLIDLDLHAWSSSVLSKIVSLIGVSPYADRCSSLKEGISCGCSGGGYENYSST